MVKFKSKLPSMIIACIMALVIMVSAVTPAFAAGTASIGSVAGDVNGGTIVGQDVDQGKQTEYDEFEVTGNMTSNADVYVTVAETDIMVTVPKVVILDGKSGASNVGEYTVKVQGDIAAETVINVVPQDEMDDRDGVNFEMSSVGKDNIPTDVEQANTEFTYADGVRADAAASTTGTVTAYGMTAGQWNGDFVFNISAGKTYITNYTAEEIEASEYLFGIGQTKAEYVVAEFNEDYTEVTITKNGEDSDGITKNFSSNPTNSNYYLTASPTYQHKGTLKKVVVKEGVTTIGYHLFRESLSVESVQLPQSLTSIGSYSFYACNGLTEAIIPDNVTSIGEYAFFGCDNLENAYIGDGVITIGRYAFAMPNGGTSKLATVYLGKNVETLATGVFSSCNSLKTINLPNSIKSMYSTFDGCTSLVSVTIPNQITSIQTLFDGCTSLVSVTIPESVTSYDAASFRGCDALKCIYGVPGSYAETIAQELSVTFEAI